MLRIILIDSEPQFSQSCRSRNDSVSNGFRSICESEVMTPPEGTADNLTVEKLVDQARRDAELVLHDTRRSSGIGAGFESVSRASLGRGEQPALTEHDASGTGAQKATSIALEVLTADPAVGPIEVRYIAPNEDVRDRRFLILLFGCQKAFLVDRTSCRMKDVSAAVVGREANDARSQAVLDNAKTFARSEKLALVYVVRAPA